MTKVILTFHGIGSPRRTLDPEEFDCWLEQDAFEAVLDLAAEAPDTELTFDDGNASDVEIALPALLKRHLTATFFVCSGRIDRPAFLSASQLRALHRSGMTIGSHGIEHTSWRHVGRTRLGYDLASSRAVLECHTKAVVDTAACPYGEYDHVVLEELRAAGYRTVYTSERGVSSDSGWLRPRNTVQRSMPLSAIEALLFDGPPRSEQLLARCRTLIKSWR